jgi:hypothetical protein
MWKNILGGQWIESEDDINTAITASLLHLSKDEYRAEIDRLPHRSEECVGDYTE